MRWLTRLFVLFLLILGIGVIALIRSEKFSKFAIATIESELAKQDIFVSIGDLYFDPIRGLMAENFRLFEDEERSVLVTEIEKANLKMNYPHALKGKWEFEGLKITDAHIQLPSDPQIPTIQSLEVAELSTEIKMHEGFIEVKKLEGMVMGLKVKVEANLVKTSRPSGGKTDKAKQNEQRRELWEALRVRRQIIVQVAKLLDSFHSPLPPELDIKVEGDISKPSQLKFSAKLAAQSLKHSLYECDWLEGSAIFENGVLDVPRLYVRDRLGEIKGSAQWQVGEPEFKFQVTSRADVMGFLGAVTEHPFFKEFLIYEPLELEAQGSIAIPAMNLPTSNFPVKVVGSFGFGKFLSRGEMFESLSGKFSVGTRGVYLTGVKLEHSTGGIEGRLIWDKLEGIKFSALYTMDLRPFLPFVKNPHAQQSIKFFEKHPDSVVHVQLKGEAPDADPKKLVTRGRAELKRVTYRGVYVPEIEGDLEIHSTHQIFSNLKAKGPDGTRGVAKEVRYDIKSKAATIVDAEADVNIAQLVSCFAPSVAKEIAKYKFSKNPFAKAKGVVSQNVELNDFKVEFSSNGVGYYDLVEETYPIRSPNGTLDFKGSKLQYLVRGKVFEHPMSCSGEVQILPKKFGKRYSANFEAGLFPYQVFGKELPFRHVRAKIDHSQGKTHFLGTAEAFSGSVELKGSINEDHASKPFDGELQIQGIVYSEFAKVYAPGNDTEGDLTGHFKYQGNLGDWKSLKGSGAITLLNGNLYAVPILGPLTPLIGALLPKNMADYNTAKEADCTFRVEDGKVHTENIEAITGVVKLVAKGAVDFLNNRIDMEAQARIRGIPGLVFTPLSELFEYVGEGTISDPKWRPKYFSASKVKPRAGATEESPPEIETSKEKIEAKAAPRRRWFFKKNDEESAPKEKN